MRAIGGTIAIAMFAVEQDVAKTIEDRFSVIFFLSLRTMRVGGNYNVGSIINGI